MKYFVVVMVILIVGLLDYHFYSIVCARGGFDAWVQSNYMWQTALMLSFFWNFFGAVVLWVLYLTNDVE